MYSPLPHAYSIIHLKWMSEKKKLKQKIQAIKCDKQKKNRKAKKWTWKDVFICYVVLSLSSSLL